MDQNAALTKSLERIAPQLNLAGGSLLLSSIDTFEPNMAHGFVLSLDDIMDEYQAPITESLRDLFEILLREYALAPIPVPPTRSDGWAHRPRTCSLATCAQCKELVAFLVSPVLQSAEFALPPSEQGHIQGLLNCDYHWVGETDGHIGTHLFELDLLFRECSRALIVTKLSQDVEYRKEVAAYEHRARQLRPLVEGFRREHWRRILGDEVYKELILLEGLPGPEALGAPIGQQAAGPDGGVVRKGDDELSPPPAQRRRVD